MQLYQVSLRRERNFFFSQARDPVKKKQGKGQIEFEIFKHKLDNKIIREGENVQQMSRQSSRNVGYWKIISGNDEKLDY